MKFSINRSLDILKSTPAVLGNQLSALDNEWLKQSEGHGSWTPAEIVCHLIHCEEDDWVPRIKIILDKNEDKKFKPFDRTKGFEKVKTKTISELIYIFRTLREENLSYLMSLNLSDTDLNKIGIHPEFGEVTLKQLLATWVVHDMSHIAQINRVLSVQYAEEVGPWIEYIPLLKRNVSSADNNITDDKKFDWSSYYKNKSNLVPRETLTKALDLFEKERTTDEQLFAIDIGCGHGADTLELLSRNWKVLAIDNNSEGLSILEESVLPSHRRSFKTSNQSFEEMKLEKTILLNASYCIPFCKPEHFDELWNKIENAVLSEGRFAGNFFGENDSWADIKTMTFHTKEKVTALFNNFVIEFFDERDEDGTAADGVSKHWHVFSVIAKKI